MASNTLFLLDLYHTLIYESYASCATAEMLFQYFQYLTVYERPYARELIKILHEKEDIIVFTTAKENYYAQMICLSFNEKEKGFMFCDHILNQGDR